MNAEEGVNGGDLVSSFLLGVERGLLRNILLLPLIEASEAERGQPLPSEEGTTYRV